MSTRAVDDGYNSQENREDERLLPRHTYLLCKVATLPSFAVAFDDQVQDFVDIGDAIGEARVTNIGSGSGKT